MNKVDSKKIAASITIAITDREVARHIERRDNDNRLDCHFISCKRLTPIDHPFIDLEVNFHYEDAEGTPVNGEDLKVVIRHEHQQIRIIQVSDV